MGNRLPQEQARSERTKLCPIKALVYLKSGSTDSIKSLLSHTEWYEVSLTIHRSLLIFEDQPPMKIDQNFLILNHNEQALEIAFLVYNDLSQRTYLIRCKSIRQFKDLALAIFFSKRPSWVISPVCQICVRPFSLFLRDHHCRNCGKDICRNCSEFYQLEISGYIGKQRLCVKCVEKVQMYINIVADIQINEFNNPNNFSLYYNDERDSSLLIALTNN